jgi:hypothetical protein
MTCPRCGLTVVSRSPYLIVQRCPRCLARRRRLVKMEATPDPELERATSDARRE